MNAHFSMWGNSLALRIPSGVARELDVFAGKLADIQVKDGSIVVTPLSKPVYTLDELLAGITPENLHDEFSTGDAVGNEVG